jgi:hypothetical protein
MPHSTRQPRVLALRCQACRSDLPAAPHDIAFRCPQCGRAWEIEKGGLHERPSLYVAAPKPAKHPVLYLPYWSFSVSARVDPGVVRDESALKARDRAAKFQRGYVSAYAIFRPTYVGEWGITYMRLQPEWEAIRGHGPEAPGATISSYDAKTIVHHYILSEIDRAADIGGLDYTIQLGNPELWAIPCYDLGEMIRCPWTRAELQAAVLDDLSAIRRGRERLEA